VANSKTKEIIYTPPVAYDVPLLMAELVESLCPGINRRSLQRDLSDLIEKGLVSQKGIKKAAHYELNLPD
jgi:hypothetical protein